MCLYVWLSLCQMLIHMHIFFSRRHSWLLFMKAKWCRRKEKSRLERRDFITYFKMKPIWWTKGAYFQYIECQLMRNNWIKSHLIRGWIFSYYDYHKTNSSIHFRRFVAQSFIIVFFHDFVFHNMRPMRKQKAIKSYYRFAYNNISEPKQQKNQFKRKANETRTEETQTKQTKSNDRQRKKNVNRNCSTCCALIGSKISCRVTAIGK